MTVRWGNLSGRRCAQGVALAFVAGFVPVVCAAEAPAGAQAHGWLDQGRVAVQRTTEWVARGVDGWFGDRPFEDGGQVSGSVRLRSLWRQDGANRLGLTFRARLEMPNLKERSYLFLGQDNERDLITNQPEQFTREQQLLPERRREDQTLFAGLGYALREHIDLRLGVRGGYKVYAQARYRKRWQVTLQDRFDLRETVFWTGSERFGSTTAFDYEHARSPGFALRWRNAATISQRSDGLEWSSSVGAFRAVGPLRQVGVEVLINGATADKVGVREYGVRATWRQAVYRDWLMGELIVGHFWPRDDDDPVRRRSWAVGGSFEMLF